MPASDRPWLTGKFRDGTPLYMGVQYLIDHLDEHCRVKVLTTKEYWEERDNADMAGLLDWQQSKERGLERILDGGLPPEQLDPVEIALRPAREEYCVSDGITRLRVFRKRNIGQIRVKLYHGI